MATKILTAQQMRQVDRLSSEQCGIPGMVLMENAGRAVVEVMTEVLPGLGNERIGIVCGKGNNGGDGFVVARHLLMRGMRPRVVILGDPTSLQGDARQNYELLVQWGLQPSVARNELEWAAARIELLTATVLVDAILGTGLDRSLDGFLAEVVKDLAAVLSHATVFAVDMPTGLMSDQGAASGLALRAHHTVTFTAPKPAQIFPPNCESVGQLHVVSIGSPRKLFEEDEGIFLSLLDSQDASGFLGSRALDSHKGSFGHVLVVGGSRGKSGAAAMGGLAALRSGAGLVTVAVARSSQPEVVMSSPALMTVAIEEDSEGNLRTADGSDFSAALMDKSVIVLGPGLGTKPATIEFARSIVRSTAPIPLVLDADGLNAFAEAPHLLDGRGRTLVLTPHPGEMARLAGLSASDVQAHRVAIAREFSRKHNVCLVLKGARTLVAEPRGQVYVNPTGNPGMATAGSGDILSGVIAALLAQFPAAAVERVVSAAVYWHGLAGDVAVRSRGEHSLLATDLLEALPQAAGEIRTRRTAYV